MRRRASRGLVTTLTPSINASPDSGAMTVYSMRKRRRLASAVRAEQSGNAPVCRAQAHIANRGHPSKVLLQMVGFDHGGDYGGRRALRRTASAVVLHARDVQSIDAPSAHEIRHHTVHAGRCQLPVTKSLQDNVHAVCESALCLLCV